LRVFFRLNSLFHKKLVNNISFSVFTGGRYRGHGPCPLCEIFGKKLFLKITVDLKENLGIEYANGAYQQAGASFSASPSRADRG
jgi:hypothetical protein